MMFCWSLIDDKLEKEKCIPEPVNLSHIPKKHESYDYKLVIKLSIVDENWVYHTVKKFNYDINLYDKSNEVVYNRDNHGSIYGYSLMSDINEIVKFGRDENEEKLNAYLDTISNIHNFDFIEDFYKQVGNKKFFVQFIYGDGLELTIDD